MTDFATAFAIALAGATPPRPPALLPQLPREATSSSDTSRLPEAPGDPAEIAAPAALTPSGPSGTDGAPFPALTATPAGHAASEEAIASSSARGLIPEVREQKSEVSIPAATVPQLPRLTLAALALGATRARLLRLARPLFAQGWTLERVAQASGISAPTLCRLREKFAAIPDDQLTPELCAAGWLNCGARSVWEDFAARSDVQQKLCELYLLSCGASSEYMTKGRRTGSVAATLEVFSRDPICPPELASALRRGRQPRPLVNIIRRMNDLHEQRSRGPKHSSLNGALTMRRTLVEILNDGSTIPIKPGDWWVFDDMSSNLPHWWTGPDDQPMIGRQGLYCYDVTQKWVGLDKLGTVRDAYTAAHILRFLRRLMQALGKPRRGVVFERSVWAARSIKGVRLARQGHQTELIEHDLELPAIPDEEKTLITEGIRSLGLILHYTHTPRGKEIEGAFNYLQRLLPMFAAQRSAARDQDPDTQHATRNTLPPPHPINMGRHAGEYERAAQAIRRVKALSHHPLALGFLHLEESTALELDVMDWINQRPGRDGTQEEADALAQAEVAHTSLQPLSQRDLAVFLPRTHALEIHDGKVTATIDKDPYDFTHPELFASLGSGYRLLVKFDPSEPTLGAAIYNNDTSSANHRRWQRGEYIGWASFLEPIARFDWRDKSDKNDLPNQLRKRHAAYVRDSFGVVSRPRARVSSVRDGKGLVAEVSGPKSAVSGETPLRPLRPSREEPLSLPAPPANPHALPASLRRFLADDGEEKPQET